MRQRLELSGVGGEAVGIGGKQVDSTTNVTNTDVKTGIGAN